MVERTFNDMMVGGLGTVPAPSDVLDDESGIAQFGQLHPGPVDPQALRIRKESQADGYNSIDQASDRFAVLTHLVDTTKAFQILPVDPHRKRASLIVPATQPNVTAATVQNSQTANPANPAAGANFNTVLSNTSKVQIQSVQLTLTTSATVANRIVGITIAGITYFAAVAQTATLVETYTFAPGNVPTTVLPATGGQISAPIPPGLILPANGQVASNVTGLQVGDTITAIAITYQIVPSAIASVPANPGVVVAAQEVVDNIAAALVLGNPLPPVGFPIYAANPSPYIYTSKSPLYACSLNAGVPIVLNTMVERFNAGVAVGA